MSSDATASDFLSFSWWISVVFVSFLINLLSAYTKPQLDMLLSSISSRWRNRVERDHKIYTEMIEQHLQNPPLISILGIKVGYTLYYATICLLGCFFFFVFSTVPPGELKGAGFLNVPYFLDFVLSKRFLRALSITMVFFWLAAQLSASKQRQFLLDIQSRLLKHSKDPYKEKLD